MENNLHGGIPKQKRGHGKRETAKICTWKAIHQIID
jgi:hypothetical protein